MGRIGLQVAERLVPFGIKGLYCDPNVTLDAAAEQRLNMEKTDFDTLIARSDIVTLHSANDGQHPKYYQRRCYFANAAGQHIY